MHETINSTRAVKRPILQFERELPITPGERYRILEPWLRLANLIRPYLSERRLPSAELQKKFAEQFQSEFAVELERLHQATLLRSDLTQFHSPVPDINFMLSLHSAVCALNKLPPDDPEWLKDPGPAWLFELARSAAQILESLCRDEKRSPSLPLFAYFERLSDGKVRINFETAQKLIDAVNGSDADRYSHCEICGNYLYARRLGEPGCSKLCDGARRGSAWRQRQNQQTDPAAELLRKGKDLRAIAEALEITKNKARLYVTRARRRTEI